MNNEIEIEMGGSARGKVYGMTHSLAVAEQFFSIQGEGQTMGRPAYFLRLAGCNLMCGGYGTDKDGKLHDGATWRCDSIEVWKHGKRKTFREIVEDFGSNSFLIDLKRGVHLIITGGEPLLQQTAIANFLKEIGSYMNHSFTVEIETNGTIMPSEYLMEHVTFWNVSPKLSNSGMAWQDRVKRDVIIALANLHEKTMFKFVIGGHRDWNDIFYEYDHLIKHDQIWLMPAADNVEDLIRLSPIVADICKQYRVNFGQRLHIITWNKKTGV
jgi:7-carboxy-7-deazaguanine synthase